MTIHIFLKNPCAAYTIIHLVLCGTRDYVVAAGLFTRPGTGDRRAIVRSLVACASLLTGLRRHHGVYNTSESRADNMKSSLLIKVEKYSREVDISSFIP